MNDADATVFQAALDRRFSDAPKAREPAALPDALGTMAARGACRAFQDTPVSDDLIDMLCAVALSAPTKSDLQQRDIIVIRDPAQRQRLVDLVPGQTWVADAPTLLVFCGNNRRQVLSHAWRDTPFANDHLDAVFNAATDAAIALGAFVAAAEACGLGCCPISAVRNEAQAVSTLLDLPDRVFPFAGLALGVPAAPPKISKRLPLSVTCHRDRYAETDLRRQIEAYDAQRAAHDPYTAQRQTDVFGTADVYGWTQDKTRQYASPERADFGAFLRAKGFRLD